MKYLVSILIGYLLGCINPAYILGRLKGFDIRTRGSKSAGASNAKICIGLWAFFVVLVYDFFKTIIAMILSKYLYNDIACMYVAASATILGHIFPFYLGFKGGKGFASYIGMVYFTNIYVGLALTVIGLILSALCNWIVACTFTFIFSFPIIAYFTNVPLAGVIAAIFASTLIFLKHLVNLKKVRNGEEIGIFKKEPVKLFLKKDVKEGLKKEGVIS